ncbi:MAG: chemotaxis protein CheW [Salinivirgaceae bacterium]|jgi:purine-binding chemotaxis protein CheW
MEQHNAVDNNSYLVFKIGEEEFAAHASKVQRILELQPITTIPKAQKYMKGVINLMGKVLPVIDARLKMDLPEKEADANTCIVVLEIEKGGRVVETGIIVDSVQSVLEIQKHEISEPPSIGIEVNTQFIYGMVQQDSKFIMLLDVDNVFSVEEVIKLKEATETQIEELQEAKEE